MTVEQTSQLIQLILNAVLMVAVCGLVLMGMLVRQGTLSQQLQWVNRDYREQLVGTAPLRSDRFPQLKNQQLELRRHYRQVQASILLAYSALLLQLMDTLLLSLRTVWEQGWLIPASLLVFVMGNGVLLLAVGMALLEVRHTSSSLLGELRDWVHWREPRPLRPPPLALPERRSPPLPEKRISAG